MQCICCALTFIEVPWSPVIMSSSWMLWWLSLLHTWKTSITLATTTHVEQLVLDTEESTSKCSHCGWVVPVCSQSNHEVIMASVDWGGYFMSHNCWWLGHEVFMSTVFWSGCFMMSTVIGALSTKQFGDVCIVILMHDWIVISLVFPFQNKFPFHNKLVYST